MTTSSEFSVRKVSGTLRNIKLKLYVIYLLFITHIALFLCEKVVLIVLSKGYLHIYFYDAGEVSSGKFNRFQNAHTTHASILASKTHTHLVNVCSMLSHRFSKKRIIMFHNWDFNVSPI